MTIFWIVAALLILAALLFLLPPLAQKGQRKEVLARKDLNILLFKDQLKELQDDLENGDITQDQFDQAKHDLERSLLQDVAPDEEDKKPVISNALTATLGSKSAIAVALIIPIAAFALYNQLGAGKAGLEPENARVSVNAEGHNGTIEEQVRKLQDHLQSHPDDLEGWVMLARSYYFMKQYQAATDAFARAVAMTKEGEPQLLADYADAMAMANGQNMAGTPFELVKKALAIQPFHQKALWLAGTATFQSKDYKASLGYWQKLLQQFPENSQEYVQMLRNIGEVKQLMGEPVDDVMAKLDAAKTAQASAAPNAGASGGGGDNAAASGGGSVGGEVSLDPSLKDKVSPNDTLFIFARAASGPRMPLAILRMQASDLPVKFTLDDSNAMNSAMRISKFQEVVVGARISKSGNAMPQAGDLKGSSSVVKVGARDLKFVIDSAVP
jgi:cytochrome c-type biogenesis protein CcmH